MPEEKTVTAVQESCAKVETFKNDGCVDKHFSSDIKPLKNIRSGRGRWKRRNYRRKTNSDGESGNYDNGNSFSFTCIEQELASVEGNMIKELHNYCMQNDMPAPTINVNKLTGTAEFVSSCTVANIKCYGMSKNQTDACQHAAIRMLSAFSKGAAISNKEKYLANGKTQANSDKLSPYIEDDEAERRRKFQIYRELTYADARKKIFDMPVRHNFFKKFHADLKEAAFEVFASKELVSPEKQLLDVLDALKLTLRITTVDSTSDEPILMIELECGYDACFMGLESEVYQQINQYLQTMLV